MNVTDFNHLLKTSAKVVDPLQVKQLEDILDEYPYFQSARALHLKGLKNLNSYKYNKALKTTAAYTADRDVLFDFITSKDFLDHALPNEKLDLKKSSLNATATTDKKEEKPLIEDSSDKPLPQDKKDAEQILDPKLFKAKPSAPKETNLLQSGEPLQFNTSEKYSFTEWLQLTSKKPIERDQSKKNSEPEQENTNKASNQNTLKKEKFDRIDKFIAENPKIVPATKSDKIVEVSHSVKLDKNELMTETLARVYLEQKKYKKAIQAYKILSLKYPEKSGFFADRIKAVEKIQQEN